MVGADCRVSVLECTARRRAAERRGGGDAGAGSSGGARSAQLWSERQPGVSVAAALLHWPSRSSCWRNEAVAGSSRAGTLGSMDGESRNNADRLRSDPYRAAGTRGDQLGKVFGCPSGTRGARWPAPAIELPAGTEIWIEYLPESTSDRRCYPAASVGMLLARCANSN
jgi:hypothetical protein